MPSWVLDRHWRSDALVEVFKDSARSKTVVRVTESLDVPTPQSHIFSYIAARNISILPNLIERPMSHD